MLSSKKIRVLIVRKFSFNHGKSVFCMLSKMCKRVLIHSSAETAKGVYLAVLMTGL